MDFWSALSQSELLLHEQWDPQFWTDFWFKEYVSDNLRLFFESTKEEEQTLGYFILVDATAQIANYSKLSWVYMLPKGGREIEIISGK